MMTDPLAFILLLLAAVGSGLVGGIFFAFSGFVMAALDRLPAGHAIAAMQSINITVLNRLFFAVFFGTAALSLGLAVLAVARWSDPGAGLAAPLVLAGALAYLVGCILVTMRFNVPLNRRLARVAPDEGDPGAAWRRYRVPWTAWNHVRTAASLAAAAAFVVALRA